MKCKKSIIILVAICINACQAQKNDLTKHNIMIPELDSTFEKLDIDLYNKEVEPISGKRIVVSGKKYLEEEKQSYGFIRREFFNDTYFVLIKKFTKKGGVLEKAISFNNGYPIGFWYKFDEQGNLTEEIDTDKGYDYGWKKIVQYCEDHEIELTKGYPKGGFHTSVYKEEENGKKVWVITRQTAGDKLEAITLDGKTGKELNKKELEFINH